MMNISAKKATNALVVKVSGQMDAATALDFEKSISEFIAQGEKAFVINLSGLEFISSVGLRSILASAKRLKEKNGKLIFSELHGHVKEVFAISGFQGIFKIGDSDEECLRRI
ncbi:MAG: STAS domain-containing protein [Candidatus Ozemobacteraceae bacterium]